MSTAQHIDDVADQVLAATVEELVRRPNQRLIISLELELRQEVMALLANRKTEPLISHALAVRWGAMLKAGHHVDQFGLWTRTEPEVNEDAAPIISWDSGNVACEAERGAPHLLDLKRPHDVARLVAPARAPRGVADALP